jgi:hypothetical protein
MTEHDGAGPHACQVSHIAAGEVRLWHRRQTEHAGDPVEGRDGAPSGCEHDRQAEQTGRQPEKFKPVV